MSRVLCSRIVTYKMRMAILSRKHVNKKDVLVHACTKLLRCCAIALIDEKGTWGGSYKWTIALRSITLQLQVCHSDPYFHKHHVLLLGRVNELCFRMHQMDSIIWWYGEHTSTKGLSVYVRKWFYMTNCSVL